MPNARQTRPTARKQHVPPPAPPEDIVFLLVPEAAALARTSPMTIRTWIAQRRLPTSKPGRRVLIRREDLLALINGAHRPANP